MRQPKATTELATLTHARLRVGQGDYAAASMLLRRILELQPEHAEAAELLRSIEGRVSAETAEPAPERLLPPESADPARLSGPFRDALAGVTERGRQIRRLERWLHRVRQRS